MRRLTPDGSGDRMAQTGKQEDSGMLVGIISDTHNWLSPEVKKILEGCDAIFHAGDFCEEAMLDRIGAIAPIWAVLGNNDWELTERLKPRLDFTLEGVRICMAHRRGDLPRDLRPYQLAVYGHTHVYDCRETEGTVLLNPGSAGEERYGGVATMAVAELEAGKIRIHRIDFPKHGIR